MVDNQLLEKRQGKWMARYSEVVGSTNSTMSHSNVGEKQSDSGGDVQIVKTRVCPSFIHVEAIGHSRS